MLKYKGYKGRVEFDSDAGVLLGVVEGIRDVVTFEATSVAELESAFRQSVDDYLTMCAERGEKADRPYSGKYLVRLDAALHRQIAEAAAAAESSLNSVTVEALKTWLDHRLSVASESKRFASVAEPTNAESGTLPQYRPRRAQNEREPILIANNTGFNQVTGQPAGGSPHTPSSILY